MVDFPRVKAGSLVFAAASMLASVSAQADIIGVSWFSSPIGGLLRIDEKTGAVKAVYESPVSRMNSLAQDAAGNLYSIGQFDSYAFTGLVKINPRNGKITPVSEVLDDIRALSFSRDNVLYGIRAGNEFGEDPSQLVSIDILSGAVTLIGSNGGPPSSLQGLAFTPSGILYGWDVGPVGVGQGLVTVNPLTGDITDVNPGIGGSALDIQGLTFAPDGALYGAREALYKIDLETGALSQVSAGSYADIRGIEYVNVVPEPAAYLMFIMGLSGMGWVSRNRNSPAKK
ncbi:PEP-CTERM sorting domain-containing protein [Azohydromonas aeria]|uniref:PEP-CTERM sorting domain-containing protein n=1 Tax=Azohydromonas aeria TaxID=2590212 RepID=UPI0012FC20FF|nr:PEP-CTERM sorting domain-containing protein [Azohydromonas aeria]